MIGLDTNFLLRLWLNDDPGQNGRIDSLLDAHGRQPGSLHVSDVVLAEAIWTLRSAYAQDKASQLLALRSLLNEPAFSFEDREVVSTAVALFASTSCGFPDCLLVTKNARQGCEFTATFDRRMRPLTGVRVL